MASKRILAVLLAAQMMFALSGAASALDSAPQYQSAPQQISSRQSRILSEGQLDLSGSQPYDTKGNPISINRLADLHSRTDFLRATEESGIKGEHDNALILLRFQGEPEFISSGDDSLYHQLDLSYNTSNISIKNYFEEISFGELSVTTKIVPETQNSIELSHSKNYFLPISRENPEGYVPHTRILQLEDASGQPTDYAVAVDEAPCTVSSNNVNDHIFEMGGRTIYCSHLDLTARFVDQSQGTYRITASDKLLNFEEGETHAVYHNGQLASVCSSSADQMIRTNIMVGEAMEQINALGYDNIAGTTIYLDSEAGGWGELLWPQQWSHPQLSLTDDRLNKRTMQAYLGFTLTDDMYTRLRSEYTEDWHYLTVAPNYYTDDVQGNYPFNLILNRFEQEYVTDADGNRFPANGTNAHEFSHLLGFYDYYCYEDQSVPTTGAWCLMNVTADIPQYIATPLRAKYGQWFDSSNIQEITRDGTYSIDMVSGAQEKDGKIFGYIVDDPNCNAEQLFIEYRGMRGDFEGSQWIQSYRPSEGLVLYSFNSMLDNANQGNMNASKNGPFALKQYFTPGIGQTAGGSAYQNASQPARDLFDMGLSTLTDALFRNSGIDYDLNRTTFGNPDKSDTEGAITCQLKGENTGIIITDVKRDPQDSTKMTFTLDRKAPSVELYQFDNDILTVIFDEPVFPGPAFSSLGDAAIDNNRLILSGVSSSDQITVPKDALIDQVGRGLEQDLTFGTETVFFTDTLGHWAKDAIDRAVALGILNGTSPTTFSPDLQMTRGMLVTLLYRMEGSPTAGSHSFTDVTYTDYYAKPVAWASRSGIMNGVDATSFAPNSNLTREQLAAVLMRYAQYKGYSTNTVGNLSQFIDHTDISSWAYEALNYAVGAGLINGQSERHLNPQGAATRAEVATIVVRFLDLYEM